MTTKGNTEPRPAQAQAPAAPWRAPITCTYQAPYCCGKPAVVRLIWIGPPGIGHSEAPAFCDRHTEIWRKEKNDWWREEPIAPAAAPLAPPDAPREAQLARVMDWLCTEGCFDPSEDDDRAFATRLLDELVLPMATALSAAPPPTPEKQETK